MKQFVLCLFLALGAAPLGSTETLVSSGPSPCKSGIEIDPAFSMAKFAADHDGTWGYVQGVLTARTAEYALMFQHVEPTDNEGVYNRTVYYQEKNGATGIFSKETTTDSGNGGPLVSKSKTIETKVYFIKYGDGIAYYYVCNDSGVASGVDFRWVLSHGKLTPAQEKIVQEIEEKYQFGGKLKNFHQPH